jgi:hypothetical protein
VNRWSPYEEAQFDQVCTYCTKRIRRLMGNWQGYDGLFVCFTGQLPNRSDLGRRHTPSGGEDGRPVEVRVDLG